MLLYIIQTLLFEVSDRSRSPLHAQNWSEKGDKSHAYLLKIAPLSENTEEVTFCALFFKIWRISYPNNLKKNVTIQTKQDGQGRKLTFSTNLLSGK